MAEQEMIIAESSSRRISAQRIMCPLCPNVQGFSLHRFLLKHLKDIHEVKITRSSQQFANFEEFTVWRNLGNREVDYVCQTTRKDKKGEKIILYNCNRSDTIVYCIISGKSIIFPNDCDNYQTRSVATSLVTQEFGNMLFPRIIHTIFSPIVDLYLKKLLKNISFKM